MWGVKVGATVKVQSIYILCRHVEVLCYQMALSAG